MRSKLPYIVLAVLFVGYILLELFGPQPTNWDPSFRYDKKLPFASKLVYEGLGDIFPGGEIKVVDEGPDKVLKTFEQRHANYIIIQEEFDPTAKESDALLDFVRRGNDVFIAASVFEGPLAESLSVGNLEHFWDLFEASGDSPSKDDYLYFEEAWDADRKHYPLLDNVVYNDFGQFGPEHHEVLSRDRSQDANYLRVPVGEGHFYLHSVPLVFTNFYMVDPINQEYVSRALSFLPDRDVIWDEFYKPGRSRNESSLKYVLDQTSLKWAWILALCGVVLFMVFEGKRKQRIIPVLEPVTNTTLDFTMTVGMLYHAHGDHKDISEKKIKFLLEYIRNRWGIPTTDLGGDFREKLAAKSGVHRMDIERLFDQIEKIHKAKEVEDDALLQLSRWIDDFYQKSK